MATYRKYTDENGNTILEEIKEAPEQSQIINNGNQQYWEEIDRRNKATRKANRRIKIFWFITLIIGAGLTLGGFTAFKSVYPVIAGLIIMAISGRLMRNKYDEY